MDHPPRWVRLPELPAKREPLSIYLYACFSGESPPSPPPPTQVWSTDYAAVYHLADRLDDPPTPFIRDATGAYHGRALGGLTPPQRLASKRGYALQFKGREGDEAGDFIELAQDLLLDVAPWTALTLEAWAFQDTRGEVRIMCKSPNTAVDQHVFALGMHGYDPQDTPYARLGTDLGDAIERSSGVSVPLEAWFHLALTWSKGTQRLDFYVNGELADTHNLPGNTLRFDATPAAIANLNALDLDNLADDRLWRGQLDELRIHRVARGPDWIAAQHRAMTDQLVDYTFEDELHP